MIVATSLLREKSFPNILIALYIFMLTLTTAVHEPWRDEADAWLVARDCDASDFLRHGRYSGTPALWYLFQLPFARAGLPYATQKVLHAVVACATAIILIRHSPFPLVMNALLLAGYYFGYEYAVIARNYSLGNLILVTIASFWTRRREVPVAIALLIALLANVSVHFALFALVIGAVTAVDLLRPIPQSHVMKRNACAILLMAAGGLAGFLQVVPPPDSWARPLAVTSDYAQIGEAVRASLFPLLELEAALYIAAAVYGAIVLVIMRSRAGLLFVAGSAALMYVLVFKWSGGLRHHGLLLVWLVFCLWIWLVGRHDAALARIVTTGVSVVLVASVIINARQFVREWRHPYSGSQDMALYMEHHRLAEAFVAAHHPTRAGAVLAHLQKRFFYFPALGESGSYIRWDAKFMRNAGHDVTTAVQLLERQRPDGHLLLLVDAPLAASSSRYRLLHSTPAPFGQPDEQFWLYERKAAPSRGRREPPS